jgi:thioredoxin 1
MTEQKRTQHVVDLRDATEITTYEDGKVSARFDVLNLEVLGSDEDHARDLLLEVLQDLVTTDEAAREKFSVWAQDHIIEVEIADETTPSGGAPGDFPELGPETFDAAVAGAKPVLVDFWAPWCQPCLRAAPVLKELWDEHADAFDVAKVNVENYPVFNERFDIQGIPCFVMFQHGEEVDRIVGFGPKREFWTEIEKALAKTG